MPAPLKSDYENVFGIDIGGANIKLSHCHGDSRSVAFPMWSEYPRLSQAIEQLLAAMNQSWDQQSALAITMTGELADCFSSRRAGVAAILDEVVRILPRSQCHVYSVDGQWLTVDQAKQLPWQVAASNWHALANWLLQEHREIVQQCQIILDIGSTTVDIIPISHDRIVTDAKTDRQRLQLGQLVYTGMERTPIHAIVGKVLVDGEFCPVMAERFATISDVHLILANLQEQSDNCDTADGRPRTRQWALARLARMVGEDVETLPEETIVDIASQILLAQAKQVSAALSRNLTHSFSGKVLVTGHGSPLLKQLQSLPGFQSVQFIQPFSGETARCAPALAVARLWALHRSAVGGLQPLEGDRVGLSDSGGQHV